MNVLCSCTAAGSSDFVCVSLCVCGCLSLFVCVCVCVCVCLCLSLFLPHSDSERVRLQTGVNMRIFLTCSGYHRHCLLCVQWTLYLTWAAVETWKHTQTTSTGVSNASYLRPYQPHQPAKRQHGNNAVSQINVLVPTTNLVFPVFLSLFSCFSFSWPPPPYFTYRIRWIFSVEPL